MKTWPSHLPEPTPLGTSKVVALDDGVYEAHWPSGRRRLLAFVEGGRVRRWLTLEDGPPAGCLDVGNTAQRFYADGFMEDFSPWDDNSPRYLAGLSFRDWMAEAVREVLGEPAPLPAPRPEPPVLPAPPVATILEDLSEWPGDLEFRTQLEFHLRDRFRLCRAEAARLAEFMPLAFLDAPPEEYLHPVWEGTFACRASRLADVDVFRETRAAGCRNARVVRNMVHAASRSALPVVATPPPEPSVTCPLRVLEVLCELLLRAERVPGDVAEEAAAGAYMLAPLVGAPLAYVDGVLPWDGRGGELAKAQERLAGARERVLAGRMGRQAAFFQLRAQAARDYFQSFGAGRHAFPLLPSGPAPRRLPPPTREQWRDLAEEAMRLLPRCPDAVSAARMQNRLAEVGLHLSGEPSARVGEYLEQYRDPEPEVREAVRWFLDSEGLDCTGWEAVNGVLWVLDSFQPDSRSRRERVVQAARVSRMLVAPLAR